MGRENNFLIIRIETNLTCSMSLAPLLKRDRDLDEPALLTGFLFLTSKQRNF